jgi:hypothetical protein
MPDCIPLDELVASPDRMPKVIERFSADWWALGRRYPVAWSAQRRERLRRFLDEWFAALDALPFEAFEVSDRVDWGLLKRFIGHETRRLERESAQFSEMASLLPGIEDLLALEEERRGLVEVDPAGVAERLEVARRAVEARRTALEERVAEGVPGHEGGESVAWRAAGMVEGLVKALGEWHDFHAGYCPEFTWWVEQPFRALEAALKGYVEFLRQKLAGAEDEDRIVGDPVGREALVEALEHALIPYSPEELIEIGRRELAWCAEQMVLAARKMGCRDDWHAALERVKSAHEPPGRQPMLVRDLAFEAIEYLEQNRLVTVPPLAKEGWRMEMMSAERQKTNPFFLGGETIVVSFPTHEMPHADKRMSLRGNNRAFTRATVQHELVPGHYLQAFSQERYRPYRRLFYTPFWVEGWALHWELLLWDLGFPRTPEERMGMLFWRKHRCARVVFSLSFHLGTMTSQECVDMLVNEVGHEPSNAKGEVRRSFGGQYDPLYQCAYLIGGLQVQSLRRELVGPGRMTDCEFHDAILRENTMPIAALRALLTGATIGRELDGDWRFLDETVEP